MRFLLAGAVALSATIQLAGTAGAGTITGKIKAFECGDNCYLVITTKAGKEITALCEAKACEPWIENFEIPKNLVGRRVKVKMVTSKQYDGAGNVMGDFPGFKDIKLLPK